MNVDTESANTESSEVVACLSTNRSEDWINKLVGLAYLRSFVTKNRQKEGDDQVHAGLWVEMFTHPPKWINDPYIGLATSNYVSFFEDIAKIVYVEDIPENNAKIEEQSRILANAIHKAFENCKKHWKNYDDLKFEVKERSKIKILSHRFMIRSYLRRFFNTVKYCVTNDDWKDVDLTDYPENPVPLKDSLRDYIAVSGNRSERDTEIIRLAIAQAKAGSATAAQVQSLQNKVSDALESYWKNLIIDLKKKISFNTLNNLDDKVMATYHSTLILYSLKTFAKCARGRFVNADKNSIEIIKEMREKLAKRTRAMDVDLNPSEINKLLEYFEECASKEVDISPALTTESFSTAGFIDSLCKADAFDIISEGYEESYAKTGPCLVGKHNRLSIPEFKRGQNQPLHMFINNCFSKSMIESGVTSKSDWLRCLFFALPVCNRPQYSKLVIDKLPSNAIISDEEYQRIIIAVVKFLDPDVIFSQQDFRKKFQDHAQRIQGKDESIKDFFLRLQEYHQRGFPETHSVKTERVEFCRVFVDSLANINIRNKIKADHFSTYYDKGDIREILNLAVELERHYRINRATDIEIRNVNYNNDNNNYINRVNNYNDNRYRGNNNNYNGNNSYNNQYRSNNNYRPNYGDQRNYQYNNNNNDYHEQQQW